MKKKKRVSEKDFRLLLSFLVDRNQGTVILVKNQLRSALEVQPRYRKMMEQVLDPSVRKEAQKFMERLRYESVQVEFHQLFQQGPKLDLERGVTLLAKMQYPHLKCEDISRRLDQLASEVDKLIAKEPALPTRPLHALRRYFFEVLKFRGNQKNFYDPDNSFINKILQRKMGIPISLSVVYMLIGWRLNLLVHGVGLPGHFLVGHRIPRGVVHIDPFNKGRVLSVKECEVLVRKLGVPFKQKHLDPMTNFQILSRMILNLINIYSDRGEMDRAHWLAQIFQILQ